MKKKYIKLSPDYGLFEKHGLNTDTILEKTYQCCDCLKDFSVWEMELEPFWKCYTCLDAEPDSAENYEKENPIKKENQND